MPIFTGSGVAIATPFNDDFTINYNEFKRLIEFQIANGTDAIIVAGTTGEASTLTDSEQIELIRFAAETVNKRVPVVAGAGSNETFHCLELSRGAESAGADALLLVTPYYNKTTPKGLVEHYRTIAGNVNIPIILYNVPSRTGMNVSVKTAYELSKIDNITGIKEASGNFTQIAEIAHLCAGRLDIYSGNDDQNVPIMSLGGVGAISVLANVAPKNTHDMLMSFLDGDTRKAAKLQLDAVPLISALFCETSPIPVKAALNMMGFDVGRCRMPLAEMEEANFGKLKSEMASYGLI